jgi:hypothetical protein
MLLSEYVSAVTNLIQAPTSPVPLINAGQLVIYINSARAQAAIDAECIRGTGSASVTPGVAEIPIQAFSGVPPGVLQAIVVRNAQLNGQRVDVRPWDWFYQYYFGGAPVSTIPTPVMAHQGQGVFSSVFVSSPSGGNLVADLVFIPQALADDTSNDALPYPWTEAAPFYAAWYAYQQMQRQADAEMMKMRYHDVMRRGRTDVTSTNLPENDPGGMGALMANAKSTLGAVQPQPAQGQGR